MIFKSIFKKFVVFCGLMFAVLHAHAEVSTWTDKEGKKLITNLPEECLKTEEGRNYISNDCISGNSSVGNKPPGKSETNEKSQRQLNKEEMAKLRKEMQILDERMYNIKTEINRKREYVRKFPKDPAYKKSLEISRNQYQETSRQRAQLLQRWNHLMLSNSPLLP